MEMRLFCRDLSAAFLVAGQPDSRQRAIRNLEWMFSKVQLPSDLFYAVKLNVVSRRKR